MLYGIRIIIQNPFLTHFHITSWKSMEEFCMEEKLTAILLYDIQYLGNLDTN